MTPEEKNVQMPSPTPTRRLSAEDEPDVMKRFRNNLALYKAAQEAAERAGGRFVTSADDALAAEMEQMEREQNPILGTTPDGDTVEIREVFMDDLPDDMPEAIKELLRGITGALEDNAPHVHVTDVSFLLGDDGQNSVHATLDLHGLDPAPVKPHVSAVFQYARLPEDVREAWMHVVSYLESHLNSDSSLIDRINADARSTLECDIHIDTAR